MSNRTSNIILIGMVVGALLGAILGFYLGDYMVHISFLGTIFLNVLKMIVVPLIFVSMVVGVTSLGDIRKLGRTTGKTLLYYLATTGFSVLIGLILVNILRPGDGIPIFGAGIPELVSESGKKTFIDIIVSMFPANIFGAAVKNQILPVIIFALVFGGMLASLGRHGKPLVSLFEIINSIMMKLVMFIIYFAPVGVFAIIAGIVAENQSSLSEIVSGMGMYTLTVILGLLVHAVVILPIILHMFGRKSPLQYFLNMGQALATAFTTASSSATLPITMDCAERKNKIDKRASSFVLPLGATINMDGTALYEAVAAMFIAQMYGIDLTIADQLVIFFTATLASIGAAGIPHAGTVTMVFVLTAVGLPLEGIGLIWAIDWFLDRCRTTVNVWGDSVGAAVISETPEIKRYRVSTDRSARTQKTYGVTQKSGKSTRYNATSRTRDDRKRDDRKRDDRKRTSPPKDSRSPKKSSSDRPTRKPKAAVRQPAKPREQKPQSTSKPGYRQQRKSPSRPTTPKPKKVESTGLAAPAPIVPEKTTSSRPDKARTPEKTEDKFFDKEFSKMNLFDADTHEKSVDTQKKESAEKPAVTRTRKTDDVKEKPVVQAEPESRKSDLSVKAENDLINGQTGTKKDEQKEPQKLAEPEKPEKPAEQDKTEKVEKLEKPAKPAEPDEQKKPEDSKKKVDDSEDSDDEEQWGRGRKKR